MMLRRPGGTSNAVHPVQVEEALTGSTLRGLVGNTGLAIQTRCSTNQYQRSGGRGLAAPQTHAGFQKFEE